MITPDKSKTFSQMPVHSGKCFLSLVTCCFSQPTGRLSRDNSHHCVKEAPGCSKRSSGTHSRAHRPSASDLGPGLWTSVFRRLPTPGTRWKLCHLLHFPLVNQSTFDMLHWLLVTSCSGQWEGPFIQPPGTSLLPLEETFPAPSQLAFHQDLPWTGESRRKGDTAILS